jgi:hypothetical protein
MAAYTFTLPSKDSPRICAAREGYFETLSAYPWLKTVFFKHDMELIKPHLIQKYYGHASNNCTLLDKYTSSSGCKNASHSVISKTHGFEDSYIKPGLPQGYKQEPHDETWTYIHIIPNAAVSEHGDIFTSNFTLVPTRCRTENSGLPPRISKYTPVYDEVFVIHHYWDEGFYHSTFESTPRLAAHVKFLNDNPSVRIFSVGKNPIQTLFGITNWLDRQIPDHHFVARVLYSPAGGGCGLLPILTNHLTSFYAKRGLANNPAARDTIVLIKRSSRRWFRKHNAIAAMLEQEAKLKGLRLFVYRDDPVPDLATTREVFNRALIIVAPHGAGESNMIFSQPGTAVIEGVCFMWGKSIQTMVYRMTSQLLGLRYFGLFYEEGCLDITVDQIRNPVTFYLQYVDELRE